MVQCYGEYVKCSKLWVKPHHGALCIENILVVAMYSNVPKTSYSVQITNFKQTFQQLFHGVLLKPKIVHRMNK